MYRACLRRGGFSPSLIRAIKLFQIIRSFAIIGLDYFALPVIKACSLSLSASKQN